MKGLDQTGMCEACRTHGGGIVLGKDGFEDASVNRKIMLKYV
jgi:hypothetical protein